MDSNYLWYHQVVNRQLVFPYVHIVIIIPHFLVCLTLPHVHPAFTQLALNLFAKQGLPNVQSAKKEFYISIQVQNQNGGYHVMTPLVR